jgi:hypothetical protein
LFDYGLDDITSNLEFLKTYQPPTKKNGAVAFGGEEKQVYAMVNSVEKNGEQEALRQQVWRVWIDIHSTKNRVPRNWD